MGVRDERDSARREEHLFVNKDGKIIFLKCKGLVSCSPHEIPIIIDPNILTLNEAQMVKKAVWDIVKSENKKQTSMINGRAFAIPPKELAAIFRCRPEILAKYLCWYDLKFEGLSFRLIALIEFFSKTEDREKKFEQYIGMKKKPRIGLHVKRESTIRKGFGVIYKAIFITSAPTQEDLISTMETYNCPEHGSACDGRDCDYTKKWLRDFNNRNKEKFLKEQLRPF